ncbi:MAG: GlsB/YeaQ/YmgE family stress response membrane protein [Candidatus Thiodiazotropha sp. (ex Semelilucina semeliformis)]|nr:GlsB/YeaQ/YmgE family stress response membrane protein [Candidatus Thiodiazotropha sp. (ex Myrtea spinifera)]MCU7808465.1 GlsB/YeaQ/YmgE family stress response membrane protein [Candidatus Thiodiazotropha sp. (ex Semelilucina semeliformis)]MCU7809931.1 GlsB/YeaQ/YmgE family stress response membrane protein [Candidatus Thiodiazotropha sp. (ex Notomyrtea botanica)]MCU7828242.1 GlsB/YeaQ/YmgE family stress response membrane protein [Candidatus Thiodiazotropha sp. (ex Myrtea sp. 'scaly one' KF741
MGIISWIVLGLIAGALAKWIMPGKDDGGFIITILLGVAGAFVGGYLSSLLGFSGIGELSIVSILTATAGAFLLLFVYRLVKKNSA